MASRLTSLQLGGTALIAFASGMVFMVVGNSLFTGDVQVVGNISTSGTLTQSGGLVPLRATLTGSGQFFVQNPTGTKIKCSAPTIYTATAASPASRVDVDLVVTNNKGAPQNSTGSLFTRVSLSSVGLQTSTGSAVSTADGQTYFMMDEAGGVYDYIFARGTTGTGQNLVAYFHADCYRIFR